MKPSAGYCSGVVGPPPCVLPRLQSYFSTATLEIEGCLPQARWNFQLGSVPAWRSHLLGSCFLGSKTFFPESACEGFFVKKQPLYTSSHLHICWSTSSHPHTCWSTSSHPHTCWSTSSHLHICWSTSSHPHICRSTSSHLHIFSRSSFYISLLRRGRCRRSATKRYPFARNGRWTSKTEVKLRFNLVHRSPFARNGRWTSKTEVKLWFYLAHRNAFSRNGRWTSKLK